MQGLSFHLHDPPAGGTAPVLSSPTVSSVTDTTTTIGVTTDTPSAGTMYWVLTTSATEPTAAQIKAASGGDIVQGGNTPVVAATHTFNLTGLTAGTAYWGWFLHNEAAEDSLTVGTGAWATTGGGAHAHFDAVSTGAVFANGLRNSTQYATYGQGSWADYWSYNGTEDALECELAAGEIGVGTAQMRFPFSTISSDTVDDFSWQYEIKYDSWWAKSAPLDAEGLDNHKLLQLADDSGLYVGDNRRLETQHRYSSAHVGSDVACVTTYRKYHAFSQPSDNSNPLRVQDSNPFGWQPGGDTEFRLTEDPYSAADHLASATKPFLNLPGTWIRVTGHIWKDGAVGRLKVTMSDENNDPVVVIDDPTTADAGYEITWHSGAPIFYFNIFWLEFTTSQAPYHMVAIGGANPTASEIPPNYPEQNKSKDTDSGKVWQWNGTVWSLVGTGTATGGASKKIYMRNLVINNAAISHGSRPG